MAHSGNLWSPTTPDALASGDAGPERFSASDVVTYADHDRRRRPNSPRLVA